jgi:predicted tellurium resistance membrane protein TerC
LGHHRRGVGIVLSLVFRAVFNFAGAAAIAAWSWVFYILGGFLVYTAIQLTNDAYIIFTANALALMGLRQLYFLIGGLLEKVVYLSKGLAVVLGFIVATLIITTVLSLLKTSRHARRGTAAAEIARSSGGTGSSRGRASPGTRRGPRRPHRSCTPIALPHRRIAVGPRARRRSG